MSKNVDTANDILECNAAIQIKDQDDLLLKLQYLLNPNNQKELETYQRTKKSNNT